MKIHFAFNLEDKGTPNDVETIGILDIVDEDNNQVFNKEDLVDLINEIVNRFILEIETIEKDISKTNLL